MVCKLVGRLEFLSTINIVDKVPLVWRCLDKLTVTWATKNTINRRQYNMNNLEKNITFFQHKGATTRDLPLPPLCSVVCFTALITRPSLPNDWILPVRSWTMEENHKWPILWKMNVISFVCCGMLPPPSNSHHQDHSIFTDGRVSTSFCLLLLWRGSIPKCVSVWI